MSKTDANFLIGMSACLIIPVYAALVMIEAEHPVVATLRVPAYALIGYLFGRELEVMKRREK
jgi:hypothetical protein